MEFEIGQQVCLIKDLNLFKRTGAVGVVVNKKHRNNVDWIDVEFPSDGVNSFDFLRSNVFCFTRKDMLFYLSAEYSDFQDKIRERLGCK